jgi:hypothetical protein
LELSVAEDFGHYGRLASTDIVRWMKEMLNKRGYKMRWGDGKIHADLTMAHETPWVHVGAAANDGSRDCYTLHTIMFDVIRKATGQNFVPSRCQGCWKVVARPKTLIQLFAVGEIQRQMRRPSKHGIELRPTVHGLYGAYWYNNSLEEGQHCYRMVREAINKDPLLGPDIVVLLKRGCTEFEHACGDSSKWEISKEQKQIEEMVSQHVVSETNMQEQPQHLINSIWRRWIEFAYANGDPTYKKFTNGKPLYPDYVTYHEDVDKQMAAERDEAVKKTEKKKTKKEDPELTTEE